MKPITIRIVTENGGVVPVKATKGAAAYDVYAPADFLCRYGRNIMPLNFRLEIPEGYEAMIEPRSGYSSKGIEGSSPCLSNAARRFNADALPGKIDSDYRGVVGVIIRNCDVPFHIHKGTRIAQMTFRKVESVEFVESDELTETDRNEGGFGSTNSNANL